MSKESASTRAGAGAGAGAGAEHLSIENMTRALSLFTQVVYFLSNVTVFVFISFLSLFFFRNNFNFLYSFCRILICTQKKIFTFSNYETCWSVSYAQINYEIPQPQRTT